MNYETIGETVKYNGNLDTHYSPELIEKFEVYNSDLNKFDSCEHWGWNNEGEDNMCFYDFGRIANFYFEISKSITRLYYAEPYIYGYYKYKPTNLVFLPFDYKNEEEFVKMGYFSLDRNYPAPILMRNLGNFIDHFLFCQTYHIQNTKIKHAQEIDKILKIKHAQAIDEKLPF